MKQEVMVCGIDCHKGNANCNGYCMGKAASPPIATNEMVLSRAKERLLNSIAETEQRFRTFCEAAKEQLQIDNELLRECLKVLEYATYHDGRYGQVKNETFQKEAQPLVIRIVKRLGVKPLEGF